MSKTICLRNGTVFTGIAIVPHTSVIIEDNKIADVISNDKLKKMNLPKDTTMIYVNGAYIAPGFIDTHIHGIHGYDTSEASVDSILEMSKALVNYGVTGFCPTLYPQDEKTFIQCIEAIRDAMGKEEGAKIYGMNLEGPFISREKHGALDPKFMKPVDMESMEAYYKASGGNITIMTVAPELEGMHELALYCAKHGIVMAAGHSNATYEDMMEGVKSGILHSTHFFNAMRRLHHRDPGVVGAIMIYPNIACEIIADGYHIHPAIVKLLQRVKPIHKIVLVTDSLRPTGQMTGKLTANHEEVFLRDGLFVRKEDETIAGSALTMITGVRNLVEDMNIPLEDALRMASCNPATVISKQIETGYIMPGREADIVVFDENYDIKLTMVHGEIKKMME
ncbi:MAG: N-acetylglucosamine-6-phosphate deacetylase [Candidatus Marinimicrobia bacterium]|nr:N-acetylglucosamine-6-phosphate deacetylase [Candidatus Neomarinimicrobiota bacterium]